MATNPGDHNTFEELAAGHALDSLDAEDERRFLQHLAGCEICPALLVDYGEMLAVLAESAPEIEPPPELGARIRAAALSDGSSAGEAEVVELPEAADRPGGQRGSARRQGRWNRIEVKVAAAVLALLLAGGGIYTGLRLTAKPATPVATCTPSTGCQQVTLLSLTTHKPVIDVQVRDDTASVVPAGLPADQTSTHIYVLWQISEKTPIAIGGFDVHTGVRTSIDIGRLVKPFTQTAEFAVSLEKGRTIPPAPSVVVAAGVVGG